MDPKTLRYAPTHEWASLAGDVVTVGVTAFAAEQLGDVTLVEFKKPGTRVEACRLDLFQGYQVSQCVTNRLATVGEGCGHDCAEVLADGKRGP